MNPEVVAARQLEENNISPTLQLVGHENRCPQGASKRKMCLKENYLLFAKKDRQTETDRDREKRENQRDKGWGRSLTLHGPPVRPCKQSPALLMWSQNNSNSTFAYNMHKTFLEGNIGAWSYWMIWWERGPLLFFSISICKCGYLNLRNVIYLNNSYKHSLEQLLPFSLHWHSTYYQAPFQSSNQGKEDGRVELAARVASEFLTRRQSKVVSTQVSSALESWDLVISFHFRLCFLRLLCPK